METLELKIKVQILLGLLACLVVRGAAAEEVTIVPYVEVGVINYTLDFGGTIPFFDVVGEVDETFNLDMIGAEFGAAVSYGPWYANGSYRFTDDASDVQATPGLPVVKWIGDREEWSVGVGYNLAEGINVFGGYRDSTTDGSGNPASNYSFEHDGYYLGASYRLALTDTGGLIFSFGHAWLDASLSETFLGLEFPDADGDGSGIKFGVIWRDFINQNWGYSVGVERFDYDYDLDGDDISLDIEENETTIMVGLFYMLD